MKNITSELELLTSLRKELESLFSEQIKEFKRSQQFNIPSVQDYLESSASPHIKEYRVKKVNQLLDNIIVERFMSDTL